jgi:hypothetical protein
MSPISSRTCIYRTVDEYERMQKSAVVMEPLDPWLRTVYENIPADTCTMRSTPPQGTNRFLKRSLQDCNVSMRTVRFAHFDVVYMYETEHVKKQDLWWSKNELNEYRLTEFLCRFDPSEKAYLNTYNQAFREFSVTKGISIENVRQLALGSACGFRGLESTVSREWICTRRLDVRCIVASVIAMHMKISHESHTGMDVTDMVSSHSERLTYSHRIWSAIIGETDCIGLTMDNGTR